MPDMSLSNLSSQRTSRRNILRLGLMSVAAIPAAPLLSACGGSSSATDEVVYVGYGGSPQAATQKFVLDPFAKDAGVTIKATTGASDIAKFRAMVEAGKTTWDTVEVTTPVFSQLVKDGLIREMDFAVVPKDGYENSALVNNYAVPQYAYAHCVFWNTKKIPDGLNSWADVWNVKDFPGKRGFQRNAYYLFEAAAMADGVAPEDLYPMNIDRVLDKIAEIKEHIVFQDLNTIQNLVAQGEVVTGDLNLSRVQTLISDGVPLKYSWNQNIVDAVWWVMPKGSPNPKDTAKLIAYTVEPDVQLALLNETGFTPSVSSALEQLSAEERKDLPGTKETLPSAATLSLDYYAEYGQTAQRRLDEWLLKA